MRKTNFSGKLKAAGAHLCCSIVIALLAALVVFGIWYPFPYSEISAGRELFILVCAVDVVAGPLLTLIVFSRDKRISELKTDISSIALLQIAALIYGLSVVWQSRPVYLVFEIDRYKVVAHSEISADKSVENMAVEPPRWWRGPEIISIREPVDNAEREKVLFESMHGGPDYAERPDFYVPFTPDGRKASAKKARKLKLFLDRNPDQKNAAMEAAQKLGMGLDDLRYIPIIGRQDWIAVINPEGQILAFLPGDGF